jgi:glycerophosphoryl diester phosphodiesterase
MLRQARRLDAGDGERIPTLREVLDEIAGRALLVMEIKARDIEKEVLAVVRRAKALEACVVHSFSPRTVARIRELEPKMPASLLTGGPGVADQKKLFDLALSINAQGIAVNHDVVTPQLVRAAHLRELRFSTWTVDGERDVRRVVRAGVDAITTDYPDRVRRWLRKSS